MQSGVHVYSLKQVDAYENNIEGKLECVCVCTYMVLSAHVCTQVSSLQADVLQLSQYLVSMFEAANEH